MTPEERLHKLQELKRLKTYFKLLTYKPYPKQMLFHSAMEREVALFGANRGGKTFSAGMATAMHLTGLYPDWWPGRRFKKAVRWGVGSETGDLLKKGPQRMLFGPMEDPGSGTIPRDLIVTPPRMNRGVPDGIDTLQVRHCGPDGEPDGTLSAAVFMSYADGRAKWASDDWDGAWLDEEPDLEIYTEALTRTNVTMGPVMLTFTPLKGMSDVAMRFVKSHPGTAMVSMPIEDALHFSAEQRQSIIDSYPEHEREARTRGVPMLGEGRIFQHPEETLKCERFEIPEHFAVLGAMDFGIDHPFAAVKLAWDRDTDTVFVTQCFRQKGLTPVGHASALRHWGKFPWAWPHDGLQRDKQSGIQLAQFYRDEGLELLSEHAQYPDKRGNGLEASILDMNQRMESGRLKVFSHLEPWFEEYRFYHRKDGLPVKERDDLMSATRYGVMCLRYATVEKEMPKSDRYRVRNYRKYSWLAA